MLDPDAFVHAACREHQRDDHNSDELCSQLLVLRRPALAEPAGEMMLRLHLKVVAGPHFNAGFGQQPLGRCSAMSA